MITEIRRTTKFGDHDHIVFLSERGGGISSENAGHHHLVMRAHDFIPDPQTGQLIPTDRGWEIQPAGSDNHQHDLSDEQIENVMPTPKSEGDEDNEAKTCLKLYKSDLQYEADNLNTAAESEEMAFFDQWEQGTTQVLRSRDRSVLNINVIQAKVSMLSGFERQNPTEPKYIPLEGGNQLAADVYTQVMKQIAADNMLEAEKHVVFIDELVPGRGVMDVWVDYDTNPQGRIVVERYPWQDILFGPHEKLDLSDLEHLHKCKWFSIAKLKEYFPGNEDKISALMTDQTAGSEVQLRPTFFERFFGRQYVMSEDAKKNAMVITDPEIIDIARKEIKIVETWRKEYVKKQYLVSAKDSFHIDITDWSDEDKASAESLCNVSDMTIEEGNGARMRITLFAGNILLDDYYPNLPCADFQCAVAYAIKRGNRWNGWAHYMKDPQREFNKRRSQMTDIINGVGYGWLTDKRTFISTTERENFKKNATGGRFVAEVNDTNHPPVRVDGGKFPNEIALLEQLQLKSMDLVTNLPELPQNTNSGREIVEYRRTGLVGNEYLFNNLDIMEQRIWRICLPLINHVYSPDRILKIVQDRAMRQQIILNGQPVEGQLPEDLREQIREMLNSVNMNQYDVSVEISPWAPSVREANFRDLVSLRQQGAGIPDSTLLKMSGLPNDLKKEALRDSSMAAQAAQQNELNKQRTEIVKTQIAHQPKEQPIGGGIV